MRFAPMKNPFENGGEICQGLKFKPANQTSEIGSITPLTIYFSFKACAPTR